MHHDSLFSFTSDGDVVARYRGLGLPSLYTNELTPEQNPKEFKVLQRAMRHYLWNKNARTGFILAFKHRKSALDQAKQWMKDGKRNVVRFKIHIPKDRQRPFSPVYFGNVAKLTEHCKLKRRRGTRSDEFVFMEEIPAEYIVSSRRLN